MLPCVAIPLCPLISADTHISLAKEDRQLYTLEPITAVKETPPASNVHAPLPATRVSGPVRTQRKSTQARMQTGPLPAVTNTRISGRTSNNIPKTNETPADTTPVSPIEAEPTDLTKPTQPGGPTPVSHPNLLDSASPVTDDMSVDEEVLPVTTTASSPPCDSIIQVRIIPTLGTSALVQSSPPALLLVDKDERPHWLLRSVHEFLQYAPCYLCLNKVVDLFFAQEAQLGYPAKVSKF